MRNRPDLTAALTRGLRRFLTGAGFDSIAEFSPTRGLRADICALSRKGEIWIIEIKSGLEDYRADHKWRGYAEWCDRFYFGVGAGFPLDLPPPETGLIQADAYDAAILRPAPETPLAAPRRRALTLKFARDAARRLHRFEDPPLQDDLA